MTPELSAHLSEEALNDILIGLGSPQSEAHLAVCGNCRAHLQEFQSTMQRFNQASLAWSEAKPAFSLSRPSKSKVRQVVGMPLSWSFGAIAAAVLLMIGIPLWQREHSIVVESGPAVIVASEDSELRIAQDNELLKSVYAAINVDEESPVSEYHLSERSHVRAKARMD